MKKLLLLLAAFAAGLTVAACGSKAGVEENAGAVQDMQEVEDDSLVIKAKHRQERIDGGPYMTAIGRGLTIGDFVSSERQRQVPDSLFEAVSEVRDKRLTLSLPIPGDTTQMSMDMVSEDEGKLFRVHVAMLPPDDSKCGMVAIVMGLYDEMWSEDAVQKEALKCIPCGSVWVCGSNPTCNAN